VENLCIVSDFDASVTSTRWTNLDRPTRSNPDGVPYEGFE
jgi:hypothetical protein